MNFLKKAGLIICSLVLPFALFMMVGAHMATATIGSRDTVKGWLGESGFYDNVIDSLVAETQKPDEGEETPEIDPEQTAAIKQAFSPEVVQTNLEKVLDGIYGWLEGSTDDVEFNVDLSNAKQLLAANLGEYAEKKATELPVCQNYDPQEEFDALNATCRPPSVTPAQIRQDVERDIQQISVLDKTRFTGDDLRVDQAGQKVPLADSDPGQAMRRAYVFGSYLLPLAAGLSVIAAIGLIFLSPTKRRGLRRTGVIVLITGVLTLLGYLMVDRGSNWLNNGRFNGDEGLVNAQDLLANLASVVGGDVASILLRYAVAFIIIGVGALLFAKYFRKGSEGEDLNQSEPKPPVDDSPKSEESSEPVEKPKSKKPPRKIQL